MAIWVMVLFAIAAMLILRRTPFGRWVYAVGGNERAAELSGVPVKKVKLRVYVISGFCAAVTGLIISSELTSAAPQLGETFELNAIAAVVIGGAALTGGRGNVRGVLIGAFVIGFLSDGLVMVGVSTFWQVTIKGAVIILASCSIKHSSASCGPRTPHWRPLTSNPLKRPARQTTMLSSQQQKGWVNNEEDHYSGSRRVGRRCTSGVRGGRRAGQQQPVQ